MRFFVGAGCALMVPATSYAHVGHIADLAGHDHVVTGAVVLGGTILAGVLGALAGSRSKETSGTDAENGQEA